MDDGSEPARIEDVHALALAMPHVSVEYGTGGNPVYLVGGKSFVFSAIPDRMQSTRGSGSGTATSSCSGLIESEAEKEALVQDESSPFFTTRISMVIRQCCCAAAVSVT